MPTPCPFLRKNMCSIYDIRPIVCVNYPIDQSGEDNLGNQMVSLDEIQQQHIQHILNETGWKINGIGGAAEILQMKPSTLRNRMKKLGIKR